MSEERREVKRGNFRIVLSGTLSTIWGLSEEPLRLVLYELAKRKLIDRARDETLSGHDEVELTTASGLDEPPFIPDRISLDFGVPIEIEVVSDGPTHGPLSTIAGEIIELRDNVNALAYERLGCRLLSLPQERHLLDLFLDATTKEEFGYRVSSLAGLATSFNVSDMRRKLDDDAEVKGSIDVAAKFLRLHLPSDDMSQFLDTVSHLNRLRRMFPIHTDTASGVMQAFQYFEIDYPASDFGATWKSLLNHYRDALKGLIESIHSDQAA